MDDDKETKEQAKKQRIACAWASVNDAEKDFVIHYLIEGLFNDGTVTHSIQISGSDLQDCVQQLTNTYPNFAEGEISFTGGWLCTDYDVTHKIKDLLRERTQ
jgi:hypothetical protein